MTARFKNGLFYSLFSVFGNMASTGFAALALIIISRVLGPEQFGLFSALVALSAIVSTTSDLGFNAAMVKYAGETEHQTTIVRVFSEVLRIKFLISLIIIGASIVIYPALAQFLRIEPPWFVLIALMGSVAVLWYEQLLYMTQSLHLYVKAVLINTCQAVLKLLVVLVLLGTQSLTLLSGLLLFWLAPLAPVVLTGWFLPHSIRKPLLQYHAPTRVRLIAFARHTTWMAVTAAVIENIDVLFVQRFLSDYETGLFAGAWRIAMLILLIGYSLGTVLNPRVSRYKSYADKRAYVQKALLLMGALVIAFLVSVPILPWIVSLTIGPQYLPSVPVLVPLIAAAFLSVATVPLAALFYQFQAAWYFSVTAAVQLSIILVGNWFWVPTGGLMAAGLTRLTAQATAFALTVIVAAYYLQRAHKTQS